MAATPQFIATPRSAQARFINADNTTTKTLMTMGSTHGVVHAIWLTSNDTVSHFFTLLKSDGSVEGLVDSVSIPAATALIPVQRVNLLDLTRLTKLDPNNIAWYLPSGHGFKGRMEAAVSVNAEVSVFVEYGEF